MKIAYLANIRFPSERAHSVQIVHMASAFSQNGAKLDLFVNTRSRLAVEESEKYYSLSFPFTLKRISHGFFSPRVLLSYYFSELFFALNFSFTQKPAFYDVIYSRNEWIIWTLSFFIPAKKLVWESHEAKLTFPARHILKKSIKTVVISEGIYEAYKKYGISEGQMIVAHDGIDDSFFGPVESKQEARARLELPFDKKIAMYIGGFDSWKGVETFFRAAQLVEGVLFVAIGGSEKEVAKFKVKYPHVRFLGSRPYSELKHNQQAADILVVPNTAKEALSAEYTSPLKLFGHMASGVPLCISNIPSLVQVTGNEHVSIFSADDPQSLAAVLCEMIQHYENKKQQAQELKRLSIEYTWEKRAIRIKKFLSESNK